MPWKIKSEREPPFNCRWGRVTHGSLPLSVSPCKRSNFLSLSLPLLPSLYLYKTSAYHKTIFCLCRRVGGQETVLESRKELKKKKETGFEFGACYLLSSADRPGSCFAAGRDRSLCRRSRPSLRSFDPNSARVTVHYSSEQLW